MTIQDKPVKLSRYRPLLNRFALIFIFIMANLTGRFEDKLITAQQGFERWSIALNLLALSTLSGAIFVGFTLTVEKYLTAAKQRFVVTFLTVTGGLFLTVVFLLAINPFASKLTGIDFGPQFENVPLLFARMAISGVIFTWLFKYETEILSRLRFAGGLIKKLEKNQEQLVEAEEHQRTQASRFLHDRVQAELMVVALQIANIEKKIDGAEATELATARARLETLRRVDLKLISNALTPNIEDLGLEYSVHELISQLSAGFNAEVQIDDVLISDNTFLQLGIYRIIEQALINSITHGPASNVKIVVGTHTASSCRVFIQDDGPGVTQAEASAGFGTVFIDSWVAILKATKEVSSTPGEGYALTVVIPI